jgi:hypothetical protein
MKTNVWRRETSPEEKIKTGGTVLVMVGCYTMSLHYKNTVGVLSFLIHIGM